MNTNDNKDLALFVDKVYENLKEVHSPYAEDFQNIKGGCNCIPPTEWYGDIYLTFSKLLDNHVISDSDMNKEIQRIVRFFSTWFH